MKHEFTIKDQKTSAIGFETLTSCFLPMAAQNALVAVPHHTSPDDVSQTSAHFCVKTTDGTHPLSGPASVLVVQNDSEIKMVFNGDAFGREQFDAMVEHHTASEPETTIKPGYCKSLTTAADPKAVQAVANSWVRTLSDHGIA